jgi:hypothetical protein
MKLLVVVVNYRTPDLTIDCLTSLAAEMSTVRGTRVIVTDSASGDDSVAKIQAAIDSHKWDWVTLMPLEKNGGFAAGNNAAIAPALKADHPPQYVYLLKPDTVVLPDALRELVKFMDTHPEAGIAGGRSLTTEGHVIQSSFRFHTVLSEFEGSVRLGVVSKALNKYIVAPPAWVSPLKIHTGGREHDRPPRGLRKNWTAGREVLHVLRGDRFLPPRRPRGVRLLVCPFQQNHPLNRSIIRHRDREERAQAPPALLV